VKIRDPPILVGVGQSGGFEVQSEHLSGEMAREPKKPRLGRLGVQPGPQYPSQRRFERLNVAPSPLRVAGLADDGRGLSRQVEGFRREAGQLGDPKARPAGQPVQHDPVAGSECSKGRTLRRRLEQRAKLGVGQYAPYVAALGFDVGRCLKVGEQVRGDPAVTVEPAR
jgi:hypothetical protein